MRIMSQITSSDITNFPLSYLFIIFWSDKNYFYMIKYKIEKIINLKDL